MGSYKWGYKSPNMAYNYSYPIVITPLIITHEPPSNPQIPNFWVIAPRALNTTNPEPEAKSRQGHDVVLGLSPGCLGSVAMIF